MNPIMGNIYYADLPFEKDLQSGKRPVIVTQNNKGNKHSPRVHVVPLTSHIEKAHRMPTHVVVNPSKENGLSKPSVALAEDLRSVPKDCLLWHMGTLEDESLKKVGEAVRIHLSVI